ncbi:MAG: virulence factor TspB C-terminal domain-related protein [Hydrogenophaga sp.]|uniref:virulence factor TspB C-terminal domain-related protein n=1 Tax=Hydrogenophaga sp. TaxID=1904254 RepID=UPI002ABBB317|nr:virulence factor TspB C-terminal domain-related protein [Hydrogenophaga sp.]MDZ4100698.1 virulence factor TspB C-terminal domain-related protein [Hydrogenophaga sp.]
MFKKINALFFALLSLMLGLLSGPAHGRTDSGFSSIAVVSFGAAASCPAPLPFDVAGRTYSVSFQSICTNANDYIRPVVLVLGAALAAFIFVAGFRS